MDMRKPLLLTALLAASMPTLAQAAPAPVHVRGTIVSSTANAIVVNTGSETEKVALEKPLRVVGIVNSSLDKVTAGEFIGTTVAPQPDGSLKALEVHIFPASMRGTGEGYYPWDKQARSMMANATVASAAHPSSMMANATIRQVGSADGGRTVRLVYKGGAQTVIIPPNAPIVTFQNGTPAMLVPGAHVFVIATQSPSGLVARAVNVGEHGLVPPM
jgi:hypothetical protein